MRKVDEVFINGECLKDILEDHWKWFNKKGGKCADLHNADLKNIDLSNVYLAYANLKKSDLSNSNLSCSSLMYTNLFTADLSNTNLAGANLSCADLSYSDLSESCLSFSILNGANLNRACLKKCLLNNIEYNENTICFALQCPEEGSFIGYKKCHNYIVKLLITKDALRSSATTRKCRCSKAKVLSITNLNGTNSRLSKVPSDYDKNFIYKVGRVVKVKDFDTDRWNECSTGIHFFITRQEAVNY